MALLRAVAVIGLLALSPVAADGVVGPDPGLSPRQVVEIQLDALQRNDEPGPDAGIARVWQFAHPANRAMTGPLSRFTAMIHSPPYRPLIDHRAHRVEPIRVEPEVAMFEVTVTAASGRVVAYLWQLQRLAAGARAGSWMTITVSPPLPRGEAI